MWVARTADVVQSWYTGFDCLWITYGAVGWWPSWVASSIVDLTAIFVMIFAPDVSNVVQRFGLFMDSLRCGGMVACVVGVGRCPTVYITALFVMIFVCGGLASTFATSRTKGGDLHAASGFSVARAIRAVQKDLCAAISAWKRWGPQLSTAFSSFLHVPTFLCSRRAAPLGFTSPPHGTPGAPRFDEGRWSAAWPCGAYS